MPESPHPISITVYDLDNVTLKSGAKVYVRNVTKKSTSSEETTNASGVALIDLANLPLISGQTEKYEIGDVVHIISYDGSGNSHDSARYVVAGSNKTQTLYLNPIPHTGNVTTTRLIQISASNYNAVTSYFAKVYAIDDGELLAQALIPKGDSRHPLFGSHGRGCSGGFIVERENQAVLVTATFR